MIGADYPLLDLLLTMVFFLVFVVWVAAVIAVVVDIFRSRDLSGWGKVAWFAAVLFVPIVGVIAYLVVRGDAISASRERNARAQDAAQREYVRMATGGAAVAGELEKLARLRDRGALTDEEFEQQKALLLG